MKNSPKLLVFTELTSSQQASLWGSAGGNGGDGGDGGVGKPGRPGQPGKSGQPGKLSKAARRLINRLLKLENNLTTDFSYSIGDIW